MSPTQPAAANQQDQAPPGFPSKGAAVGAVHPAPQRINSRRGRVGRISSSGSVGRTNGGLDILLQNNRCVSARKTYNFSYLPLSASHRRSIIATLSIDHLLAHMRNSTSMVLQLLRLIVNSAGSGPWLCLRRMRATSTALLR
jgi:hypothetical protein